MRKPSLQIYSSWTLFALASLLIGLISCDSIPKIRLSQPKVSGDPCRNADWFEVGRIDGSSGIPISTSTYVGRCETLGIHHDTEAYLAGWNRGLIDYCTPDGGFEAGRSGREYSGVCPANVESKFIERFLVGKKIAKLERENLKIDFDVDRLLKELVQAEKDSPDTTPESRSILTDAINRLPGVPKPVTQAQKQALRDQLQNLRAQRERNEIEVRKIEQQ